jgi:hypothetical protein
MLVGLLFVLTTLVACWLVGSTLLAAWGLDCREELRRAADAHVLATLAGIGPWSACLLAVSLVAPLTPGVAWAIAAGGICLCVPIWRRRPVVHRAEIARLLVPALGGATVAALVAVQPIQWYDTGAYHHMALRLLADFGTIAGQGLLEHRLGFSTQWFTLAALWDHGALRGHVTGLCGVFVLSVLLTAAGMGLWRVARGEAALSDWFAVVFVAAVQVPMGHLFVTPSPDAGVLLLTFGMGWCLLVPTTPGSDGRVVAAAALSIGAGAFGLKASGAGVALVAALYWTWHHRKHPHRLAAGMLAGLLLCAPMLAHSIRSTGHLLFPTALPAFDLPWTLPESARLEARELIHLVPRQVLPDTLGLPQLAWLQQAWPRADPWGFAMAMLSLAATALIPLGVSRRQLPATVLWTIPLAWVSIALYATMAPLARFAAGSLVLLPCLLLAWRATCQPRLGAVVVTMVLLAALLPWSATRVFVAMTAVAMATTPLRAAPESPGRPTGWAPCMALLAGVALLFVWRPLTDAGPSRWWLRPPPIASPVATAPARLMVVNDWSVWVTGPESVPPPETDRRQFLPWDLPFPATSRLTVPNVALLHPAKGPAGGWRLSPVE